MAQMKGIFMLIKIQIKHICQKWTFDPFLSPQSPKWPKMTFFEKYDKTLIANISAMGQDIDMIFFKN